MKAISPCQLISKSCLEVSFNDHGNRTYSDMNTGKKGCLYDFNRLVYNADIALDRGAGYAGH